MVKLSDIASRWLTATDAAMATAIGGGTTTAEAAALREMLGLLGNRKDLLFPLLRISGAAKNQIQPE